jgi:glycerol-3-phosphate acyltransferase PlsX
MGGDKAPTAILKGCFQAAPLLEGGDIIYLVGDEKIINDALTQSELPPDKKQHFQVVATTQVVEMDDSPVEAIRNKPDSSISVMCKLVSKGEAEVAISAGNTGACVAAAQLRMRTLPGVSRPGIAVVLPTFHGPVTICDVGANIAPKPRHLQQYAIMAGAYCHAVCGIENPRVGLLSIGEEDAKGTTMVKEARQLMRDEPLINFVGNVEGRDLPTGACDRGPIDVVVCDGFVGNVVLKFYEAIAPFIIRLLKESGLDERTMMKALKQLDYSEHGGAPLLGVNGVSIISHGKSSPRAIKNAIKVAVQAIESRMDEHIGRRLQEGVTAVPEGKPVS